MLPFLIKQEKTIKFSALTLHQNIIKYVVIDIEMILDLFSSRFNLFLQTVMNAPKVVFHHLVISHALHMTKKISP